MTTANFMGWDNPGVALITGASSGIGAEFAKQLAAQGFDLILIARRRELLDRQASTLHAQHGINTEVIAADLSRRSEVELVARRISTIDRLDILINNAGFGRTNPFAETDLQSQLDMIEVHNAAPTILTRNALPGMLRRNRGCNHLYCFDSGLSTAPQCCIVYAYEVIPRRPCGSFKTRAPWYGYSRSGPGPGIYPY